MNWKSGVVASLYLNSFSQAQYWYAEYYEGPDSYTIKYFGTPGDRGACINTSRNDGGLPSDRIAPHAERPESMDYGVRSFDFREVIFPSTQ